MMTYSQGFKMELLLDANLEKLRDKYVFLTNIRWAEKTSLTLISSSLISIGLISISFGMNCAQIILAYTQHFTIISSIEFEIHIL